MKRFLVIIVLIISTVWGISAQELALDEAITKAARDIEKALPQRSTVLVLNIVSPSTTFTNYVLEEITDHLIIGQSVSVVDRQNLSTIRAEMNFQYSGEVSDESMVSIGKMLGAQYIVSGSFTERGINYRLRFRIISIETARIINTIIIDVKNDAQVARLIGGEAAIQQAEKRQREAEKERQLEEQKAERERLRNLPKTADARNNWLSVGVTIAGGGIKYERMLHKNWSLGGDFYFQYITVFGDFFQIGGGITTRVYPFGKAFYIGLGLGVDSFTNSEDQYYINGEKVTWNEYQDTKLYSYVTKEEVLISYYYFGISIVPELGWRVDFGNTGGFYMDFGVKLPLVIGWRNENKDIRKKDYYSEDISYTYNSYNDFWYGFVPYIGFGIAF